ncbi:T9SS type A sorting domain-containing protein [Flavobacterium pallidum]|nr:T9SS type A sorting domain-containing protein [Flavobacterium pallidum]
MKQHYILFLLFFSIMAHAQIVTIPDANFKAKLLQASYNTEIAYNENGFKIPIDTNNNQEIEVDELDYVYRLNVSSSSISDLTGVESFQHLDLLDCSYNNLYSLDVKVSELNCSYNQLTELTITRVEPAYWNYYSYYFDCSHNNLTSINFNNEYEGHAFELHCSYNNLVSLGFESADLIYLTCAHNNFTELDLSHFYTLEGVDCSYNNIQNLYLNPTGAIPMSFNCNNNELVSIYLKDADAMPLDPEYTSFAGNPNLTYICANEADILFLQNLADQYGYNSEVNGTCESIPLYHLSGNAKIDIENNGCDATDIDFPHIKFKVEDNSNTGYFYSNSGYYSTSLQEGSYTITPVFNNPNLTASPASIIVTFPGNSSDIVQNFCITQIGEHPDVEISLVNMGIAVPGFDNMYRIFYSNKSFDVCSGTVTLNFNDATLDFLSANPTNSGQSAGQLSWNYNNLQPFETRHIDVVLNLNSPVETPPLNQGDILHFTAVANNIPADEYPADNMSVLNQAIFNAFDPNDKTCLEGDTITPQMVGEYVHYKIRFENTGNYYAAIVTVKDVIDTSKFDISTLTPIAGSHPFITRITNTNQVEFVFDNIMLPFDDANNDGYVIFKIKTKPTLVLGDELSNTAGIYFNYNAPVITNTAVTTVAIPLGIDDNEKTFGFALYPNPVKDILTFSSKVNTNIDSIEIYNMLGQQVVKAIPPAGDYSIDVAKLTAGNYIVKTATGGAVSTIRFIKE